jgi:CBS-domain-containing membrane protein
MRRNLPVIPQNASLEDAFESMQESDSPALPVVDSRRRLTGILTVENVGELMMIRSVARGADPGLAQAGGAAAPRRSAGLKGAADCSR